MAVSNLKLRTVNIRRGLEIATSLVFLILSGALLAILVWNHYHRGSTAHLRPGLRRYATLPQVKGIDFTTSAYTVIVALNTNCDSCALGQAFRTRLKELEHDKGIRSITIFPNPASDVNRYVRRTKLELAAVPDVDLDDINLAGTPTLVLVDRVGVIRDFWIGKLSSNDEAEIINNLQSLL